MARRSCGWRAWGVGVVAAVATGLVQAEPAANYHEVGDRAALGGVLTEGAPQELAAAGFDLVVDLRHPDEGIEGERERLAEQGMDYVNLPVSASAPDPARLEEFVAALDSRPDARVLVHCASGNRAGMMWGLYRLEKGATLEQVMSEVSAVTRPNANEVIEAHAQARAAK